MRPTPPTGERGIKKKADELETSYKQPSNTESSPQHTQLHYSSTKCTFLFEENE